MSAVIRTVILSGMAGASFVRADLHVHTFSDDDRPPFELAEYVEQAVQRAVTILGVTDHNTIRNAEEMVALGVARGILVLPGIEITTYQGHLLALFDPEDIEGLRDFASSSNLRFAEDPVDRSVRSKRSIVDLVAEIAQRGALAIPAHVDAGDGIGNSLAPAELVQLLTDPALAALEFRSAENLAWFSAEDTDPVRRDAWLRREKNDHLRKRGLARIMSSDAHSPDLVGLDRNKRTLTKLRLDDANFVAVKNAVVNNPKARCKAEVTLPANYARIVSVRFEGGFLDNVELELSPNLTCLIGGRGSGKSTALLALRAAVGEHPTDEDADAPERMPDRTIVRFIDELGTEREAIRERDGTPKDIGTSAPVSLRLADLGQDETGKLARGYEDDPVELLRFLDQFVDLETLLEDERHALRRLGELDGEVGRTSVGLDRLPHWKDERARLQAQLDAAKSGRVDEVVAFASQMEAQYPVLQAVEERVDALTASDRRRAPISLDDIATQHGADLSKKPASEFMDGPDGLPAQLQRLDEADTTAKTEMKATVTNAAHGAKTVLQRWRDRHRALQQRLDQKVEELGQKGLTLEAQASIKVAKNLQAAIVQVNTLTAQEKQNRESQRQRALVVNELSAVRDSIFQKRRASIQLVVNSANRDADLQIHFGLGRGGIRDDWSNWLGPQFGFKSPRLQRIALAFTPQEFTAAVRAGADAVERLAVPNEDPPFVGRGAGVVESVGEEDLFKLDRMRLEDRPELRVTEPGRSQPRSFSRLSAGQQRSVLLSLILCAQRSEPLVIDQPEDHLDAEYIADAVVAHLENAKEKRQVILATHSANLTVLGDAELVIPMYADGSHGAPRDIGSVDRVETRKRVCSILEGGEGAFKERGLRYGFKFS